MTIVMTYYVASSGATPRRQTSDSPCHSVHSELHYTKKGGVTFLDACPKKEGFFVLALWDVVNDVLEPHWLSSKGETVRVNSHQHIQIHTGIC